MPRAGLAVVDVRSVARLGRLHARRGGVRRRRGRRRRVRRRRGRRRRVGLLRRRRATEDLGTLVPEVETDLQDARRVVLLRDGEDQRRLLVLEAVKTNLRQTAHSQTATSEVVVDLGRQSLDTFDVEPAEQRADELGFCLPRLVRRDGRVVDGSPVELGDVQRCDVVDVGRRAREGLEPRVETEHRRTTDLESRQHVGVGHTQQRVLADRHLHRPEAVRVERSAQSVRPQSRRDVLQSTDARLDDHTAVASVGHVRSTDDVGALDRGLVDREQIDDLLAHGRIGVAGRVTAVGTDAVAAPSEGDGGDERRHDEQNDRRDCIGLTHGDSPLPWERDFVDASGNEPPIDTMEYRLPIMGASGRLGLRGVEQLVHRRRLGRWRGGRGGRGLDDPPVTDSECRQEGADDDQHDDEERDERAVGPVPFAVGEVVGQPAPEKPREEPDDHREDEGQEHVGVLRHPAVGPPLGGGSRSRGCGCRGGLHHRCDGGRGCGRRRCRGVDRCGCSRCRSRGSGRRRDDGGTAEDVGQLAGLLVETLEHVAVLLREQPGGDRRVGCVLHCRCLLCFGGGCHFGGTSTNARRGGLHGLAEGVDTGEICGGHFWPSNLPRPRGTQLNDTVSSSGAPSLGRRLVTLRQQSHTRASSGTTRNTYKVYMLCVVPENVR